jgi:DNA-binding beta-propeller fold protein YncE
MKSVGLLLLLISGILAQSTLQFIGVVKNGSNGIEGFLSPTSIAVSPDNKFVYLTNCRGDYSMLIFIRDSLTGLLTFYKGIKNAEDNVQGISCPALIVISQDNKNLYAAGTMDYSVSAFNRESSTGSLVFSSWIRDSKDTVINGLKLPSSVTISPDNKNVYTTGMLGNAIAVFDRNNESGVLTYRKSLTHGVNNVGGISLPVFAIVSPDNRNVYVTGESSLAVFDRDLLTGELSYSKCFIDGRNGVNGLSGSWAIAVSPDNKNVYVTANDDDALVIFDRDPSSGALSYRECIIEKNGVDGLFNADGILVSPDSKNVYVTGSFGNSLAVFGRDTLTGALSFQKCFKDSLDGIDGLKHPSSLALTPDNKFLYVAGQRDSAVAIFSVVPYNASTSVSVKSIKHRDTHLSVSPYGAGLSITFNVVTEGKINLSLYTMQGILVRHITEHFIGVGHHVKRFDLSGIRSGVYVLRLACGTESSGTKITITAQ